MNYGRPALSLVGILTAAASVALPHSASVVGADSYIRKDVLCSGAYGELGCEKTLCQMNGNQQCTESYCDAENCGGGGGGC